MKTPDAPRALDMDTLAETVARNLKRVRSARAMSLSALARTSGVARATLYQLEAGAGNPTLDTLFAVASVLGVALSELVTDTEPPPVQVIRAGEGAKITGPSAVAHLLRRFTHGSGVLELYDLSVLAGRVTHGHEHPRGVFEHVLVTSGSIRTGPEDEPVVLASGDYICFRADRPHVYEALDGDARATLLMHYPPAMASPELPVLGTDGQG